MILLTQLSGHVIYVNPDLIESLESTPDTVVTLTNGKKLIVKEPPEEISRRFTDFAAKVARTGARVTEEVTWT